MFSENLHCCSTMVCFFRLSLVLASLAGVGAVGQTCGDYFRSESVRSHKARRWCDEGRYFNFSSRLNGNQSVQVFYHCSGERSNDAILMGHGWPTSSFDFQELVGLLEDSHFICAVDMVGFGFSDKPRSPYRYSIFEHASLLDHFVTQVVPLASFIYLTHDEGDSVGLQVLRNYMQMQHAPYTIMHHIMLNGNVYLPLAKLTSMQHTLLSNITGPAAQRLLSPGLLSRGMAEELFSPHLSSADAAELEAVFAFQGGARILHETIQYLVERRHFEDEWLETLRKSPVPTTLIWGQKDPVAVPAVGDYVWENFLENRTSAPASYHRVAEANHYIQTDHADVIAGFIRNATTASHRKVELLV